MGLQTSAVRNVVSVQFEREDECSSFKHGYRAQVLFVLKAPLPVTVASLVDPDHDQRFSRFSVGCSIISISTLLVDTVRS